jgi:hypothetical protein
MEDMWNLRTSLNRPPGQPSPGPSTLNQVTSCQQVPVTCEGRKSYELLQLLGLLLSKSNSENGELPIILHSNRHLTTCA